MLVKGIEEKKHQPPRAWLAACEVRTCRRVAALGEAGADADGMVELDYADAAGGMPGLCVFCGERRTTATADLRALAALSAQCSPSPEGWRDGGLAASWCFGRGCVETRTLSLSLSALLRLRESLAVSW